MTTQERSEKSRAASAALWLIAGVTLIAISIAIQLATDSNTNLAGLVVNGIGWVAAIIGICGFLAILIRAAKN